MNDCNINVYNEKNLICEIKVKNNIVYFRNYICDINILPFGVKIMVKLEDLFRYLKSRCLDDTDNPEQVCRKTNGVLPNDSIRLEFQGGD